MTRMVLMFFVWAGASALAHWVLWRWAKDNFPKRFSEARPRTIAVVIGALAVFPTFTRILTNATHNSIIAAVFAVAMTESMIVLITLVPLLLVRTASLIFGFVARKTAKISDENAVVISRRQAIERVGGSLVLGGTTTTLVWGTFVGRHQYAVEEVVVRIVGLPRSLDGYTIAQVSDLHVGNFVQERELRRGLALIDDTHADLIVVTGDLVDFDRSYIPTMIAGLTRLRARDGIKAILGNHDYYAGALDVENALKSAGIDILKNDGRVIREADGGGFALLGVDDLWAPRYGGAGPRLDRALAAVPADRPRILLSHQPQTIDAWAGKVALQLSGHTHGGQVNPGFRPADLIMRYVAGRYDVGGTTLWVNRGFGVVGPPARVGAPPEITKIVLVSA